MGAGAFNVISFRACVTIPCFSLQKTRTLEYCWKHWRVSIWGGGGGAVTCLVWIGLSSSDESVDLHAWCNLITEFHSAFRLNSPVPAYGR